MNSPSVGEYISAGHSSWLSKPFRMWHAFVNSSNLTASICIAITVFLLLAPPMPWNIRLTLYAALLVWTILRPRVALYLIPFCVPWGSLDFIELKGLRLNSADILVIFLAIGWLMS